VRGERQNHNVTTGWLSAQVSVPCGLHTIEFISAWVNPGGVGQSWVLYVDNVAATCEPPIPIDSRTWGQIKALYR
jgi:hypothetical protein